MTFDVPKISVLVTTYNAEDFIEKTLESVFAQSLKPLEILVIDDGSSDNTVEILRKFEPEIIVLTQKNQGVSAARNALLKKAKGELVGFLDHDDYWGQDYLKNQLKNYQGFPEASCYVMGFENSSESEEMREDKLDKTLGAVQLLPIKEFINFYSNNTGRFLPSFTLFKRDRLQVIGNEVFPISCSGADDIFIFLVMPLLGPVAINEMKTGFFRVSSTSQSHDRLRSYILRNVAIEETINFYLNRHAELGVLNLVRHVKAVSARGLARIYFGENLFSTGRKVLWRSLLEKFEVKSLGQLVLSYIAKDAVRSKDRFRVLPN